VQAERPVNVSRGALGKKLPQPGADLESLLPEPSAHHHEETELKNLLAIPVSGRQPVQLSERLGGHLQLDIALRCQQDAFNSHSPDLNGGRAFFNPLSF